VTADDTLLGSTYRPVRAARAKEDAPWPGVLARESGGAMRLLVDADDLGPDWTGWDAASDGHILAPVDIARRRGGHDAVLPVCVERLEDFLRRREARLPLTAGEAVTLGVSLLRGCGQLAAAPQTTGEWWMDDGGRPVLATEVVPRRAVEATADAMAGVTVDSPLRRTWDTAVRAVSAERLSVPDLVAAEDALFALAAPEPLSTRALGPRPAAEVSAAAAPTERAAAAPAAGDRSLWQTLLHGMDADLADTVSQATTTVWRRLGGGRRAASARTGARRAPWIVGGAVAAAVLAVGALWPAGGPATADGSLPIPAPSVSEAGVTDTGAPAPAVAPVDAGPAEVDASADLVAVTAALLDARTACAGDDRCLGAVAADSAKSPAPGGVIDRAAEDRMITLLDDFGDVAVLRVDAADADAPAQLIVIERTDEKWLLRDVHDVAQQP
jgi:hypothetical protein